MYLKDNLFIIYLFQIQDDSFILISDFIDNKNIYIEETSISDLISYLLGGPIINEQSNRENFPKKNIFNKSMANLLIILDSIGLGKIFFKFIYYQ